MKSPPPASETILSDIRSFLLHKPEIPSLIKFNSPSERLNYSHRILQRLGIRVTKYKVLNIHKIGIDAPPWYVFEELLKWNGDSKCWPNNIARVERINDQIEQIRILPFGCAKYPFGLKNIPFGLNFIPLFTLNAIKIHRTPVSHDFDNARYLLYQCSGGYPIGIFFLYVRSPIREQNEIEQTQLFLVVGFNFYGKEDWSTRHPTHKLWEMLHDRVTANTMNRLKRLCEWRFEKIQQG